ncbi:MAG TPA: SCO2523 family variant P-loop protein [Actinophytocola sp.]|uniref:SCO2523 family variant P-loop protein n=1 Tax=Actinophytocola sp. TaxID=1872138 RepID=UPI002DB70E81|nr:SCO2523 family variant P-loop protein [Actinophytocola sp.]HEU5469557.1 SCO2523 family variant P-loop protein [Actinophytocola sp.]
MLVFAASDKGGTGRSVTSCNLAYHLAQHCNVAYLDFDFGSPTAGAIFEIPKVERGIDRDGLHSFIEGTTTDPFAIDVWQNSTRTDLRTANTRAGRLVMFPGDRGGAEFNSTPGCIARCVELFSRLDREFDICLVDLSAGRSHAVNMALWATADPALDSITARWLVYHRWTRQHIVAASGLVYDPRGILDVGVDAGHDKDELQNSIRFVRTAVPTLNTPLATDRAAQATWLRSCDDQLKKLALDFKLGRSRTLGSTPMEPVLQWREQVISDANVAQKIANSATVKAYRELARKLTDDAEWEGL